jgi:hypothetical protein
VPQPGDFFPSIPAPSLGPEELQIEEEVPEPKLQEPPLKVSSGWAFALAACFNDKHGPREHI